MSDDALRRQFTAVADALIGRWSLEREIGRGGMSTVYLAREVALDRPVAVKVLTPTLAADADARRRFHHEAQLGARLAHPHIVPVFAVEEVAGTVCLMTGYVDGESLRERVERDGPLDPPTVERILRDVAWALAAAHAEGILHRDVTLDNILLDRLTGRALLIDFGIAAEAVCGNGPVVIGTPGYLAPELLGGTPASPRSDLYAFGVTAWAMLTGGLPPMTDDVPALLRAAPTTPPRLAAAVESCLAADPAGRPASAEAWLARLDGAASPSLPAPVARWHEQWRSNRLLYAFGAALVTVIGTAGALADPSAALRPTLAGAVALLFGTAVPLAAATLLVHALAARRRLRAVTSAGYGVEDLRLALARAPRDEPSLPPRPHPVLLTVTIGSLLLFFALNVLFGPTPMHPAWWPTLGWSWSLLAAETARGAFVFFWAGLGFLFLVSPGSERLIRLARAARRRYWDSWAGPVTLALARGPRSHRGAPELTVHRPTELVLDLAIEDLHQALPAAVRADLGDVPAVARALRRRVAELRERLARLDAGGARTAEEGRLRTFFAERIEQGLLALERLRLRLMQLTDATLPLGAVSEALRVSREVERELLDLLAASPAPSSRAGD